jgi:hypothetical protein
MSREPFELYRIDALIDGVLRQVTLRVSHAPGIDRATVVADCDGFLTSADGLELWAALLDLRTQLDARGIRLGIAGALADVWPSGMSGQMSGGRMAYRRVPGGKPIEVDVLEPVDPHLWSTSAAEQQSARDAELAARRSAFEAWQASRDIERR